MEFKKQGDLSWERSTYKKGEVDKLNSVTRGQQCFQENHPQTPAVPQMDGETLKLSAQSL